MYVKIENGQISAYPYTVGQLRKDNPNTSFPKNIPESTLAQWGVFPVSKDTSAFDPDTQVRVWDSAPSLVNGSWVLGCTISALPQDEIDRKAAEAKAALVKQYEDAVQRMLDTEARNRGYDGILSACTYVSSSVPKFQAEAVVAAGWRDVCWNYCYTALAEVEAGTRTMPTVEELINELPAITWPA